MTTKLLQDLVARAEAWPEADQAELLELARLIEARRSGVYRASSDELKAIDEADRDAVASEDEVRAAFAEFRRG